MVADEAGYQTYRIQVFGTTQAIVSAELEAWTRFGADSLPNIDMPASGCPQGDGDHLRIWVAIDPSEVAGPIPASAFSITLPPGGAAVSYENVVADADATLINGKYRTSITMDRLGGCLDQEIGVNLGGTPIGTVQVKLRSPDMMPGTPGSPGYGNVNLVDLSTFGNAYPSPPKTYSACADFRASYGAVNLQDFMYYGSHNSHSIGGGGSRVSESNALAEGTIRLELEVDHPTIGPRRLLAKLILEGVQPFKVMVIALRTGRPELEYQSWIPNETFANATACAEITRDGTPQVFLGVMNGTGLSGTSVELGTFEFAITGTGEFELTEDDLAFLQAELLSTDGNELAFGGLRLERIEAPPSYEFELAQNYPNPFNPTTTIAFSIAATSDVTMNIYDVRGMRVATLLRGRRDAGVHRIPWDGTDANGTRVASGVYFYRLTAGTFTATRKMVLLK